VKRTAPLKQSKILPRQSAPMRKVRKGQPRRTLAVRSKTWLDLVREIPTCVRCHSEPVEAAHRDFGKGAGMKTDDVATAAIGPRCHHELGNGNELDRATRRAEMDKAIVDTLIVLARAGKVGAL
jgi:cytochrome c553